jgi:cell wall-associated NlpC family hydrolase
MLQEMVDGLARALRPFYQVKAASMVVFHHADPADALAASGGLDDAGFAATVLFWCSEAEGIPYCIGEGKGKWPCDGSMPENLDCSGLAEGVYRLSGKTLPHGSANQRDATQDVPLDQLQPSDLVFKRSPPDSDGNPGTIHHVGIYAGGGDIWNAPHTGGYVCTARLSSWIEGAAKTGEGIEGGRLA